MSLLADPEIVKLKKELRFLKDQATTTKFNYDKRAIEMEQENTELRQQLKQRDQRIQVIAVFSFRRSSSLPQLADTMLSFGSFRNSSRIGRIF